mgnify:CR=1 FL=1
MVEEAFIPNLYLVVYACEYCAYAAADLAGALRMQYPPDIKIVQIPCSGKMDIILALQALEDGVDGVITAGCLPGECHYLEGNVSARRRVERLQQILEEIGLEPQRVRMINLSSTMAGQFVAAVTEITRQIQALGANPLRDQKQNRIISEKEE